MCGCTDLLDVMIDRGDLPRAHVLIAEIKQRLRGTEVTGTAAVPPSIIARAWYQLALAWGTTPAGTPEEALTVLREEVGGHS